MAVQAKMQSHAQSKPNTVPEGLQRGLRNRWYLLARSMDMGDKPLGIRRLGEDLVLWRDGHGSPHLFPDRCPHRGAKLSLGHVAGQTLACWYHGFEFAGTGACVSVPVEGVESKLLTRLSIPSYPVEERLGMIWGYVGETDLFPPPPLDLPEELTSPEWSNFLDPLEWGVNWMLIWDNLSDPMHGPFLHSKSHTLNRGLKFDRLRIRELEDGPSAEPAQSLSGGSGQSFVVEREMQRGVNFDWSEVHIGSLPYFRIDIPYPWYGGPGSPLRIIFFMTPVDEQHTVVFPYRARRSTGWQRALWRFLYRAWWFKQHENVLWQDRVILESQRGLSSRLYEHHAQSDVGMVHSRGRWSREYARQQEVYRQAADRGRTRQLGEAEAEEQPM